VKSEVINILIYANLLSDSFVTPPLRADADTSRSAQRSLDFGRSRLNSDPVPLTSDPHRLSNHSCPDMSSYLQASTSQQPRCTRTSVGEDVVTASRPSAGSTTVKALLTSIAQRLQSSSPHQPATHGCGCPSAPHMEHPDQTPLCSCSSMPHADHLDRTTSSVTPLRHGCPSVPHLDHTTSSVTPPRHGCPSVPHLDHTTSSVTPPRRACPSVPHADHLDRTLTDADQSLERCNAVCDVAGEPVVRDDESIQSRWSTSDYFRKYPQARLDSTTQDRTPYSLSELQQCTDAGYQLRPTVDRAAATDRDASTLISSIRPNASPARHLSAYSAPSVAGSVETSSSLDSISTNDDVAFRAGLAQLDANIALVQRRLRGSLSSRSPACRSPHADSDHLT